MTPNHAPGFQFQPPSGPSETVDERIRSLWHDYLIGMLGLSPAQAQARTEAEVSGNFHTGLLQGLSDRGWRLAGARVLDIGCGTGALMAALVSGGAEVVGVEPGWQWASVASARFGSYSDRAPYVLCADGGALPIDDRTVQYVLSLQVLEHMPMESVRAMLSEVARVLAPGGRCYLTFENYGCFYEPHYRVFWLPYLPRPLGRLYLRLRGRDPAFFLDHVFYNHFILVLRHCVEAGLYSDRWAALLRKLEQPELVMGWPQRQLARIIRKAVPRALRVLAAILSERHQFLCTGVSLELYRA